MSERGSSCSSSGWTSCITMKRLWLWWRHIHRSIPGPASGHPSRHTTPARCFCRLQIKSITMAFVQTKSQVSKRGLVYIAGKEKYVRAIWSTFQSVSLNQISQINRWAWCSDKIKLSPIQYTQTCSNSSDQRSALNWSGHSKISEPLANHFLHRANFYFVHHGIKNTKFVHTNGSDIISRKTHESNPFMHQT